MGLLNSLVNIVTAVSRGTTLDAARAGAQLGSDVYNAAKGRGKAAPEDPRAAAYARNFTPVFVSKYIDLERQGQGARIPSAIRASVEGFVRGRAIAGPDVNQYVYAMLYNHRLQTGRDHPLP